MEVGRLFALDEAPAHEGDVPVAVLGHAYWQDSFRWRSGPPQPDSHVGREVIYRDRGAAAGRWLRRPAVPIYLPMATLSGLRWDDRDSGFGTGAIGRLRTGVDLTAARHDIDRANREVREQVGTNASKLEIGSLTAWYLGDVSRWAPWASCC